MNILRVVISCVSSDEWCKRIAQTHNVSVVQENWYEDRVPCRCEAIRRTLRIQLSGIDGGYRNDVLTKQVGIIDCVGIEGVRCKWVQDLQECKRLRIACTLPILVS